MFAGINHIVLTVNDINRSALFYSVLFDIPIVPSNNSFDLSGISLGIFFNQWEDSLKSDIFDEKRVGLDHFAITVSNETELPTTLEKIKLAWKTVDNTVLDGKTVGIETCEYTGKKYICFRDPDNIQIEFYTA